MKLRVKVIPGARETKILGIKGEELVVKISVNPQKGKANKALLELLAEKLSIPKSNITLIQGESSRHKVVEIKGDEKVFWKQLIS